MARWTTTNPVQHKWDTVPGSSLVEVVRQPEITWLKTCFKNLDGGMASNVQALTERSRSFAVTVPQIVS